MSYILKQKFNIRELANLPVVSTERVLLIVDEDYLRGIYEKHLLQEGFEVVSSDFADVSFISEALETAGLLVVDFSDALWKHKLAFLKVVGRDFPGLAIITIGYDLGQEILEELMVLGVRGHLERKFSQPRDLVEITRVVLR